MEKISHSKARKNFLEGNEIIFCPSNCCPNFGSPVNFACSIKLDDSVRMDDRALEWTKTKNRFMHYNCNDELGTSIHYYLR